MWPTPLLPFYEEIRKGRNILFEGAQGVLLDVDHGTVSLCHFLKHGSRKCLRGGWGWSHPDRLGHGGGKGLHHAGRGGAFPTELRTKWENRLREPER